MTDGSSALALAKNIQSAYLSEKQGKFHDNPKVLAIVDLDKFSVFLNSWDELSAEMKALIDSEDPEFFTQVTRARNSALSFDSAADIASTKKPSALDIGNFIDTLERFCAPVATSRLRTLMDSARFAYNEIFVVRGTGPGTTTKATGMHVLWPVKQEYYSDPGYFDEVLFDTDLEFATTDAPNWLGFLVRQ